MRSVAVSLIGFLLIATIAVIALAGERAENEARGLRQLVRWHELQSDPKVLLTQPPNTVRCFRVIVDYGAKE